MAGNVAYEYVLEVASGRLNDVRWARSRVLKGRIVIETYGGQSARVECELSADSALLIVMLGPGACRLVSMPASERESLP